MAALSAARPAGAPGETVGTVYPLLRWFAVAWLLVYVPAYANTYGTWHFFFLCNLGLLISVLGWISGEQLLLSSQLLIAVPVAVLWAADAVAYLLTGSDLHGGTRYLWDASLPPLVRVLSLYHLVWPLLLVASLHRHGYDRRAFALQSGLTTIVFALALFVAPAAENLNYLVRWPSGQAHSPSLALAMLMLLIAGVYLPMHWLARRTFAPARRQRHPCLATAR